MQEDHFYIIEACNNLVLLTTTSQLLSVPRFRRGNKTQWSVDI